MDYSNLSDEELLALKKNLEYDISKYSNFQLVRKIQLNSAYGAIGNEYFRYFSTDIAEAITLSGQLSIQYIANSINRLLNQTLGTTDEDYIVASDTDSMYICLDKLVSKVIPNEKDPTKISKYLDKACESIIQPFIDKEFNKLRETMNAYENKMVMGREVIAEKGIWTAKKRYILNMWNKEGVQYKEPKLKIMGIETTRSSTPEAVRKDLESSIKIIMSKDEDALIDFIEDVRQKFMKYRPEDVAFPRSANGLGEYADNQQIYRKSTPIQVKGALIYNHYIKKYKLDKKYKQITDGDKIKFVYLKKPNPLGGVRGQDHVISFINDIPKEFELDHYIDYDMQFDKAFMEPLRSILTAINWKAERVSTLESLFG
jgi:DNA polymerase elongation subunit (family B)